MFPSLWEGTPLTAFEALAIGKPIVATDADGLLDILTDGHDAVDRAEAGRRRAGGRRSSGRSIIRRSERASPRRRGVTGRQYDIGVVRPQDGAPLHAPPRSLPRDPAPRCPSSGSVVSDVGILP